MIKKYIFQTTGISPEEEYVKITFFLCNFAIVKLYSYQRHPEGLESICTQRHFAEYYDAKELRRSIESASLPSHIFLLVTMCHFSQAFCKIQRIFDSRADVSIVKACDNIAYFKDFSQCYIVMSWNQKNFRISDPSLCVPFMFLLLLVWSNSWTNSQVASDLKNYYTYVTSSKRNSFSTCFVWAYFKLSQIARFTWPTWGHEPFYQGCFYRPA